MQTTSSKRRLCWESLGRGGRSSLDDCCDWNGRCLILGSAELSLQVIAWRLIGSLNAGDHPVAPLCIRVHRRRTFGQRCQVRFWAWAHMALVQTSPRPWGTSSKYRQHPFIKSGSARATYKHDMYGDCLLFCWNKFLFQVFSFRVCEVYRFARHRFGCRILCRLLEHCTSEGSTQRCATLRSDLQKWFVPIWLFLAAWYCWVMLTWHNSSHPRERCFNQCDSSLWMCSVCMAFV